MRSNYRPAIELAGQLLTQGFAEDIEEVIAQGAQLDRSVQQALREVGHKTLEGVDERVDATLTDQYKNAGWEIERHPRVNFKTLFGPVKVGSAYLSKADEPRGIRPMKEVMGVLGEGCSEVAERAWVDFGSEKTFGRAAQQLEEHDGWEAGRGTVLHRTEAVAEQAHFRAT